MIGGETDAVDLATIRRKSSQFPQTGDPSSGLECRHGVEVSLHRTSEVIRTKTRYLVRVVGPRSWAGRSKRETMKQQVVFQQATPLDHEGMWSQNKEKERRLKRVLSDGWSPAYGHCFSHWLSRSTHEYKQLIAMTLVLSFRYFFFEAGL